MSHISSKHLGQKIYKNSDDDYRTLNYRNNMCTEWVNRSRPIGSQSQVGQHKNDHQIAMAVNHNRMTDSFFNEKTPTKDAQQPGQSFFIGGHVGNVSASRQRHDMDFFPPNDNQLELRLNPQRHPDGPSYQMAANNVAEEKKVRNESKPKSRDFFGKKKMADEQSLQQLPSTFYHDLDLQNYKIPSTDVDPVLNGAKLNNRQHHEAAPRAHHAEKKKYEPNLNGSIGKNSRIRHVHRHTRTITRTHRRKMEYHRADGFNEQRMDAPAGNPWNAAADPQAYFGDSIIYSNEGGGHYPQNNGFDVQYNRQDVQPISYFDQHPIDQHPIDRRQINRRPKDQPTKVKRRSKDFPGENKRNRNNELVRIDSKRNYYQNEENGLQVGLHKIGGGRLCQEQHGHLVQPPNECVIKIEVQCLCKCSDH